MLGHVPAGVVVEMPHKKPPKRELTFSQKLHNRLLGPSRVVIEHAYSNSKCLRLVGDTLRLRGEWERNTVMVVACGLHNLRAQSSPGVSRAPAREFPEATRTSSNVAVPATSVKY